jgi:hypothetical protein
MLPSSFSLGDLQNTLLAAKNPKTLTLKITTFDPVLSTVFSIFGPVSSASAHREWGLEG